MFEMDNRATYSACRGILPLCRRILCLCRGILLDVVTHATAHNMKTRKKVDFGAKRESPSPHIRSVQYCGGCSVHWRLFSTSGR